MVFHLHIYWHLYSFFCLLLLHPFSVLSKAIDIQTSLVSIEQSLHDGKRRREKLFGRDVYRWKWSAAHICSTNVYLTKLIRAWTVQQYDNRCTCLKAIPFKLVFNTLLLHSELHNDKCSNILILQTFTVFPPLSIYLSLFHPIASCRCFMFGVSASIHELITIFNGFISQVRFFLHFTQENRIAVAKVLSRYSVLVCCMQLKLLL